MLTGTLIVIALLLLYIALKIGRVANRFLRVSEHIERQLDRQIGELEMLTKEAGMNRVAREHELRPQHIKPLIDKVDDIQSACWRIRSAILDPEWERAQ